MGPDFKMPSPLLTEADVAKQLGISVKKLQKDRQLGIGLTYIKIGRAVRYSAMDLEDYLNSHRVDPTQLNITNN